jgi:hypothetical protein
MGEATKPLVHGSIGGEGEGGPDEG